MLIRVLLCCCLLGAAGGDCEAEIAIFTDGRTVKVSSYEVRGTEVMLELSGGGSMELPIGRIERIIDDEYVPPPKMEDLPRLFPDRPWTFDANAVTTGPDSYLRIIFDAAKTHDVDPSLVTAVIRAESNFDPSAVSKKGAQGLMQLMPATAERFGVTDSFNTEQNIFAGTRYLRWLLDRFDQNPELAVAAYNAGEGNVTKYGGVPPFRETVEYVKRVARHVARREGESPSGRQTTTP